MVKVIIVGEVMTDIELKKLADRSIFTSLLISQGNESIKIYANKENAVKVEENVSKGMIVYAECRLRYAKYSKWKDTFNLELTEIKPMYDKKKEFKNINKEGRKGLNGKLLPY